MTLFYVSESTGSDANKGYINSPFKTIMTAANLAQPGDSILVQPGIYRERITPPRGGSSTSLPIVYKSVIPQGAILRGSAPWVPRQQFADNIYYDSLDPTLFTDTSAIDGANPFRVPVSVTPYGRNGGPESVFGDKTADRNMIYNLGQVFVNDKMYKQTPYKNEMQITPESWWYDMSSNQLFVNLIGPIERCQIEITNQRRVFAPHVRGLRYITVDGFIIERCGNNYPNQFWMTPQNQQAGMIGTRSGRFWTIQNNMIRFAAGIGIDWGNEGGSTQDLEIGSNGQATGSYGHIIKSNKINDNGAGGTASFMGKNFTFSNNVVERNNNLLFTGSRRWESAGLKVHTPSNSIIMNNIIRNNYCNGIWSDQGAGQNSIFKNNIIVNNEGNGLNFEIGSGTSGKVLNNIFDGNVYNISFVTSGGCLIAHNLFLSSQNGDIDTTHFTRPDKWDSLNIEIYYNIFTSSPTYLALSSTSSIASRFMNYNQYAMDEQFICKQDKIKTKYSLSKWVSNWNSCNPGFNCDEHSIVLSGTTGSLQYINNEYSLSLNNVGMFPFVQRPDITDDYFGKNWTGPTCLAGPFNSLCDIITINVD